MKVKARKSFGEDYECEFQWDCFVQCGDKGLVVSKKENYTTAFFEAFPKNPSCFLRGEGSSIKEAEQQCWNKLQNLLLCNHEMERRDRVDGYAYCKHCSYSSMIFEPLTNCKICNEPTRYTYDINEDWYCQKHHRFIPIKFRQNSFLEDKKGRIPRKLKKQAKIIAIKNFRNHGHNGKVIMEGNYIRKFKCGNYSIGMFLGAKKFVRNNK